VYRLREELDNRDLVYGILAGDSIAFSWAVEFDFTDEEGRSSKRAQHIQQV
jgi:hypothetical protein